MTPPFFSSVTFFKPPPEGMGLLSRCPRKDFLGAPTKDHLGNRGEAPWYVSKGVSKEDKLRENLSSPVLWAGNQGKMKSKKQTCTEGQYSLSDFLSSLGSMLSTGVDPSTQGLNTETELPNPSSFEFFCFLVITVKTEMHSLNLAGSQFYPRLIP